MKKRESILEEFNKLPRGTLVMTGKLYREKYSSLMSEAAFAQAVSRLYRSGEIERVSKGVYCRPKKTQFGKILPSEREIIEWFTEGDSGVVVGYGLYNLLGVTTQISKKQMVYSSLPDEQLKQIGNVTIRKYDLEYTHEIKSMIQMMELLHHYKEIRDINVSALSRCTAKLAGEYSEKLLKRYKDQFVTQSGQSPSRELLDIMYLNIRGALRQFILFRKWRSYEAHESKLNFGI